MQGQWFVLLQHLFFSFIIERIIQSSMETSTVSESSNTSANGGDG